MTLTILLTILLTSAFYMLIWFAIGFASNFDASQLAGCIMASFVIMIIFIAITLIFIDADFEPRAIEVYRGNTTLEITYRDSIPVDSIVILK